MPRNKNPNKDKAFEVYKNYNGNITPKKIAEMLNENVTNIRTWKSVDQWDVKLGFKRKKRGAPKKNKNAVGNNGGPPEGSLNAFKHGGYIPPERFNSKSFLSKYLPKATQKIMEDIQTSGLTSLDILWTNIEMHFTALLRSQKIMNVKNQKDMTKELKKSKVQRDFVGPEDEKNAVEVYREEEYIVQFAWDKQERFLNAQSKATKVIEGMIKTYEELLHKNWDLATEEQKLRVEKLKVEIEKINGPSEIITGDDGYMKALNSTAKEDWKYEDTQ